MNSSITLLIRYKWLGGGSLAAGILEFRAPPSPLLTAIGRINGNARPNKSVSAALPIIGEAQIPPTDRKALGETNHGEFTSTGALTVLSSGRKIRSA
jgi:hypothetical protein